MTVQVFKEKMKSFLRKPFLNNDFLTIPPALMFSSIFFYVTSLAQQPNHEIKANFYIYNLIFLVQQF